jgi:LacI family transcriptional regulator, galactose operon repressor
VGPTLGKRLQTVERSPSQRVVCRPAVSTDGRRPPNKPATLADVGRLAGVSAATASRVLNSSDVRVAASLRKRVLAAAEELDYVANAHAQALMRADTLAVGVIVFDVNNPYFTEIVAGILGVAAQAGRLVTIGNVYRDPETEMRYLGLLRSQRVGAMILTGSGRTDPAYNRRLQARLDGFRAAGGRVALIGRHEVSGDLVLPDNAGGADAAARALLGLGHTRIALITGPEDMTVSVDRTRGFVERCAAAGHPVAPDRIFPGRFTRDGGASAMVAVLERCPEVTAVFCLADTMAVGALGVLRHRGIDVPGEMSVLGFDDISLAADLTPALSTVHVPLVRMGEAATRLILEPGGDGPRVEHFATQLKLRGTTGPAPT